MSVITYIMPRAIKILFFISSDITSTSLQGWLNYSVFSPTVEWDILHQVLRFLEYSRIILILSWVMPVSFILILDIKHDNVHIFSHFNWTSRIFPFNHQLNQMSILWSKCPIGYFMQIGHLQFLPKVFQIRVQSSNQYKIGPDKDNCGEFSSNK